MSLRSASGMLALVLAPHIVHAQAVQMVAPGQALEPLIAAAAPGSTLVLGAGVHRGPVRIDRPLILRGERGAIIDAGGQGSVVTIDAPDVRLESLQIVGSGSSHEHLDAGVSLTPRAAHAQVLDNELVGNLIGVNIHGAAHAHVGGNRITGRDGYRMNERGNGVYVWNAPGSVVENNTIRLGRDGIFVNTSRANVFRGNRFENLRFAIHYMYANDGEIVGNVSRGNHLGYALMFSSRLTVRGNTSNDDRDGGIMMNYANDSVLDGNRVEHAGVKCLFMYNANHNRISDNRFSACPIGIHFTAGSERNTITGNAFIANRAQVKYVGSKVHEWSADGRGNFWSDLAAFDIDGDGIADQAYRPNDAIDQLIWTQPATRLLLGSPAVHLIRWAQSRFPSLLPGGVIDSHPLMHPPRASAAHHGGHGDVAARD